jgi:hypothetical protein
VFELARRGWKTEQRPQGFTHPPLWIHESLAAKCFLGKERPLLISRRREAKRRALLQMLDRIPVRTERHAALAKPAGVPGEMPPPRPVKGAASRLQK